MRAARLAGLLSLWFVLPAAAADPAVDAAARARMEASIRALQQEKARRTPAQRKIASRLLRACRARRGEPIAEGIAALRSGVHWEADGTTLVDLRAEVSEALLRAIEALGGSVVSAHERYDAVRARLPEPAIEALAARSDVHNIRPADRYALRKDDTSEGDVAHRADDLRALHSVDGTGVSVGVMSDGVDTLSARQASGDLPGTVTLVAQDPDCVPPGTDLDCLEGTAMLEIVFDLAPGASLLFATASGGEATFASNILALEAAGADIIVDDIGYFAEAAFQDGDVAAAIDAVTAAGVLYFSAAGNEGNQNDGTSGVWEGDFSDSGIPFGSGTLHEFSAGVTLDTIDVDSPAIFSLKWADPLGGSGNDYDLYLFDDEETLIAASDDSQNGNDDPIEQISSLGFDDAGNSLGIVLFSGVGRALRLDSHGGELAVSTASQIYGHPGARGTVAVAATDWLFAGGAGGEFDGSESVQVFSSDGPRRVHYENDGTPITPGDFSTTGGELRDKPDLTGADCVTTATPGFSVFCGTSAAAPHAAAIAALLFEHGGAGTTVADVRSAMEGSALDIEAPGDDRDAGHGIVEAVGAATLLPEPGTTATLGAGVLYLAALARRRRRAA